MIGDGRAVDAACMDFSRVFSDLVDWIQNSKPEKPEDSIGGMVM